MPSSFIAPFALSNVFLTLNQATSKLHDEDSSAVVVRVLSDSLQVECDHIYIKFHGTVHIFIPRPELVTLRLPIEASV